MSMHQLLLYSLCLWAVVVFCAPTPSESRRVIFLKPNGIHRGQILATHGMEKSCPKCHMLDHRGNCRRIIAYNADGRHQKALHNFRLYQERSLPYHRSIDHTGWGVTDKSGGQ
ncbi:GD24556 [Drosophila simulans]|uniref:GD24556 n=1 Tax=Drosophila simulans TaxID=7240 RepID=B4NU80_DROSI|nr:GD24556 [Drosophila simulans]